MNTITNEDGETPSLLSDSPIGFALAADGTMSEALTLGRPQTHNELPIHYRWQRVTAAGNYTHPSTKQPVAIDAGRSAKWVKNTKLALANGVDIPASKVHGLNEKPYGYRKPENTLGNIYDARVRDGEMEVLAGYFGDDAFAIAQKNKVSVGIEMNVSDSKGNKYDELLTHLCVTPTPVLPGSSTGFVTLSRDEQTEAIPPLVPEQKGVEMLNTELKARVTQTLGGTAIPEDANEVVPLLLSKIDEAKAKIGTLEAQALTLSKEEPANPKLAKRLYDVHKREVDSDVAAGKYDRATGNLFLSRIEKSAGEPNALLLSREGTSEDFDSVRELLLKARAGLAGKEQTVAQDAITLARTIPDNDGAANTVQSKIDEGRKVGEAFAAQYAQK